MTQERFVVVFPLFPGVTLLDFAGPYEVFSRLPNVRLVLASHGGGSIETSSGMMISDVEPLGEVSACDLVWVPGGPGADAAIGDPPYVALVRHLALKASYVAAVCTGSLILGAAGLLEGKRAGSHWNSLELLSLYGAEPVADRVVQDGNIYTSGGVTSGIDLAFVLASQFASPAQAQRIQLAMQYAPQPPFNAGAPASAPPEIFQALKADMAEGLANRRAVVEAAAAHVARRKAAAKLMPRPPEQTS